MTKELQTPLRDEQEGSEKKERELEEAEKYFSDATGDVATDEEEGVLAIEQQKKDKNTREQANKNQQILIALGFTPHYHDKDKEGNDETNFGIRMMNTKIGVKFNAKNPAGKVWAYKLSEDSKKNFYKNGDLNQIPLVQKYRLIQEGKEAIPAITVIGKIVEQRGGAIIIAITENGEKKECSFGLGAVKKDDDGAFIPAGFSKATEKNPEQKMDIPRDIRLPDYETQLKQVPASAVTKEKDAQEEKVEKGIIADKIPHKEPLTLAEGEDPTLDYYISLIGEITEKVDAEERISERERGYAISKVYDAITKDRRARLIATLKKGDNHEE